MAKTSKTTFQKKTATANPLDDEEKRKLEMLDIDLVSESSTKNVAGKLGEGDADFRQFAAKFPQTMAAQAKYKMWAYEYERLHNLWKSTCVGMLEIRDDVKIAPHVLDSIDSMIEIVCMLATPQERKDLDDEMDTARATVDKYLATYLYYKENKFAMPTKIVNEVYRAVKRVFRAVNLVRQSHGMGVEQADSEEDSGDFLSTFGGLG